MEHRRRTLSSVLDEEMPEMSEVPDIEKQVIRRRGTSASIDEQLDEFTDYVYEGSFNITQSVFYGFIKLICPCFRKQPTDDYTTEK